MYLILCTIQIMNSSVSIGFDSGKIDDKLFFFQINNMKLFA